jgi:hypothetical protein
MSNASGHRSKVGGGAVAGQSDGDGMPDQIHQALAKRDAELFDCSSNASTWSTATLGSTTSPRADGRTHCCSTGRENLNRAQQH